MLVKDNRDDTARVWLNTSEYENDFLPAADGYDHALACRLGAEVGLRAKEIVGVKPEHIIDVRTVNERNADLPDVIEGTMLHVPHGKDTSGNSAEGEGKSREAYLPSDVRKAIVRFTNDRRIDDDDFLFSHPDGAAYHKKTIRNWVKAVAENAADETGDPRYRYVSSHDMRRYYATTMLQKHGLNPEVLMRVGGWEDYESLKPYLREATDEVVLEEFHRIGMI